MFGHQDLDVDVKSQVMILRGNVVCRASNVQVVRPPELTILAPRAKANFSDSGNLHVETSLL